MVVLEKRGSLLPEGRRICVNYRDVYSQVRVSENRSNGGFVQVMRKKVEGFRLTTLVLIGCLIAVAVHNRDSIVALASDSISQPIKGPRGLLGRILFHKLVAK